MPRLARPLPIVVALALPLLGFAAGDGCTEASTGAGGGEAEVEAAPPSDLPPLTPIAAVAADPSSYRGERIRLAGRLDNEGENYFTDLRVVLADEDGVTVRVWPWLPAHLPPAPPGATGARPEVLSDYLSKQVELTGSIEERALRSVGDVFLLVVEEAKKLPSGD